MTPSTTRTACATIFVSMVPLTILLAAQRVTDPTPYIVAGIVAVMAAFVGVTQDA